jgi:hypothetical protein
VFHSACFPSATSRRCLWYVVLESPQATGAGAKTLSQMHGITTCVHAWMWQRQEPHKRPSPSCCSRPSWAQGPPRWCRNCVATVRVGATSSAAAWMKSHPHSWAFFTNSLHIACTLPG